MLKTFIITFSVLGALFNAVAAVIQRYEAGKPEPKELFRSDFSKKLTKNRKWLAGFALEGVAFLCLALALRKGSLLIVAPIMTIDLVFLMLILHFNKHVPAGKREWGAIAMICVGISGMLISAAPQSGQQPYLVSRVILVSTIIAVVIAVGIYIVRRNSSGTARAAVSGVAAGFSFALVSVFTKIVTGQIGQGFFYIMSHWQVWALLIAGIVSIIMTQNVYGAGPVAVSHPTMEIVEPLVGIALGIYIFGDTVNLAPTNLFFAVVSAVIAGTGIALLGRSKRLQIQPY
jgi:drug/metabolite transporter (DMT)-like permease